MYRQLILFSIFFFTVPVEIYSQNIFQKSYGSSNEEAEGRYYELSNGGGILTGRTGTPGSYDIFVIKLDDQFEVIWSEKYGSANEYEGVKSFTELPDGNYFITGLGEYGSTTIWLLISPAGELIDSYEFGSYHDRLRNVLLNESGNLVAYGELQGMVGSSNQLSAIKLDQNFIPVWKKSYDHSGQWGGREVQARLGAMHLNPGYIFIGSLQDIGGTPSRVRLYKTDEDGKLEWVKGYHGGRKDDTRYITRNKTDDGFMIIAASDSYSNSYDILLISIDKTGNLKWSKTYGGPGIDDAKHIISDNEGNFIISGNTKSFGFGGNDAFLLKVNENGDLMTAKTYGSENEDFFWHANIVSDGYILSGSSQNDLYLVKTDKEGNNGGMRNGGYFIGSS